jgi:hypothetical protein
VGCTEAEAFVGHLGLNYIYIPITELISAYVLKLADTNTQ